MTRQKLNFRADIEGLRAIAILLVVIAHAGTPWLEGGFIGVDIFFVLSGYLITALLIGEIQESGRIDFPRFYARRFRRLAPGLFIMIVAVMLLAALSQSLKVQLEQTKAAISAILWVSNFFFAFTNLDYFSPEASDSLFLHTWSLGVEEQFYLLWPCMLLFSVAHIQRKEAAKKGATHQLTLILSFIFVSTLIGVIWLTPSNPLLTFYMMPFRAWQFALGSLVWIWLQPFISERKSAAARSSIAISGWGGLAAIIVSAAAYKHDALYPGWRALAPSLGTALIIAAGSVNAGPYKLLILRPFQIIGRLSYSWYLWHWPILLLGLALPLPDSALYRCILVGLSLLLAAISFYCIELPIRRNPRFLWKPLPMLLAIAGSVLSGYACYQMIGHQLSQPEQQRFETAGVDVPVLYYDECDIWGDRLNICIYGDSNARHTAVLAGDSVGMQWFPAIAPLFTQPGWRLIVMTKSHCPMVEKSIFYKRIGREFTECAAWRQKVAGFLTEELRPDIIILGSSATYPELDEKSWNEGSSALLAKLASATRHLYVLRATPLLQMHALKCLSNNSWVMTYFFPHRCQNSAVNEHNEQVNRGLMQAIKPLDNASIVDMNNLVCPDGICSAERDGKILFRDNVHITASFAGSLSQDFAGVMGISFDEDGNALFTNKNRE